MGETGGPCSLPSYRHGAGRNIESGPSMHKKASNPAQPVGGRAWVRTPGSHLGPIPSNHIIFSF